MTDEAERLRRFKLAVNSEAEASAARMLEEARSESSAVLKSARREANLARDRLEEKINEQTEQKLTREISSEKLASQRRLLIKRQALAESVFDRVKEKLSEFRKTGAYAEQLTSSIKEALSMYPGAEAEIHISPADAPLLKGRLEGVCEDSSVTLGGAVIYLKGTNRCLDLSYDSLLEKERAEFCRRAEL